MKSEAKLTPSCGVPNGNIERGELISRFDALSFVTQIYNRSISDILNGIQKSDFDATVIQVCFLYITLSFMWSCSLLFVFYYLHFE